MTHALMAALVIAGTAGWFLVALLPALREHFARTDSDPLRLSSEAAYVRFFAHSFHRYVQEQLRELRVKARGQPTMITTLSDNSSAWYALPSDGIVTLFDGVGESADRHALAAISEAPVRVPADTSVLRELYTSGSLEGGKGSVYRALLVDDDASLADETTIVRWVDAGGSLRIGRNSTLCGRASCWGTMFLDEGTRFHRLAAPRIEFGSAASVAEPMSVVKYAADSRVAPPSGAAVGSGRWAMDGDFAIPDGGVVHSNLVLTGTLTVGRGARIHGAIRSREVIAGDDCTFAQSIVATERMTVGERCRITGPVVVEGEAVIGAGSRIGAPGDETTISAMFVRMGRGAVLCGEVWAREQGFVGLFDSGPPSDSTRLPVANAHVTT
jgi:hypothetical protein